MKLSVHTSNIVVHLTKITLRAHKALIQSIFIRSLEPLMPLKSIQYKTILLLHRHILPVLFAVLLLSSPTHLAPLAQDNLPKKKQSKSPAITQIKDISVIEDKINQRRQALRETRRDLVKSLISAQKDQRAKRKALDDILGALSSLNAKLLFAADEALETLNTEKQTLLEQKVIAEQNLTLATTQVEDLDKRFRAIDIESDEELIILKSHKSKLKNPNRRQKTQKASSQPNLDTGPYINPYTNLKSKRNTLGSDKEITSPTKRLSADQRPVSNKPLPVSASGKQTPKHPPTLIAITGNNTDDLKETLKLDALLTEHSMRYISLSWHQYLTQALSNPDIALSTLFADLQNQLSASQQHITALSPVIILGFEEGAAVAIKLSQLIHDDTPSTEQHLIIADAKKVPFTIEVKRIGLLDNYIGAHVKTLLNIWQTTPEFFQLKTTQSQAMIGHLTTSPEVSANQQRLVFNEIQPFNTLQVLEQHLPNLVEGLIIDSASPDQAATQSATTALNEQQSSHEPLNKALNQISHSGVSGRMHLEGSALINKCLADLYFSQETLFVHLDIKDTPFQHAFYVAHPHNIFQKSLGRTLFTQYYDLNAQENNPSSTHRSVQLDFAYTNGFLKLSLEVPHTNNEDLGKISLEMKVNNQQSSVCEFDLNKATFYAGEI